jgi:hypothetical protein
MAKFDPQKHHRRSMQRNRRDQRRSSGMAQVKVYYDREGNTPDRLVWQSHR